MATLAISRRTAFGQQALKLAFVHQQLEGPPLFAADNF
jgi:hypothetical protein